MIVTVNKINVIIDEEDLLLFNKFTWTIHDGYVKTVIGGCYKSLQRILMKLPKGDKRVVDHIDGDVFNNTKANLRICTFSENSLNRASFNKLKTKGVYKNGKGFCARVQYKGKYYLLGNFKTIQEAKEAYDIKAKELHGKFYRQ